MAVPGHDERDWAFAKKFGLPIIEVVAGGNVAEAAYADIEDGVMVNSGFLNGLTVARAKKTIIDWLVEKGLGERKCQLQAPGLGVSRQRYWGEPIPLVKLRILRRVPLPYDQLPLKLPEVAHNEPTDDGESPLAGHHRLGEHPLPPLRPSRPRETDTMPQWAGSSWYFLRYIDPHKRQEFAAMDELKYWLPVDWYNGA
jgi:leucyl-tRNA synthetase